MQDSQAQKANYFKKGKLDSGVIYPEFFPIRPDETVLNIGCGDGVQAVIYRNSFRKMVGVDINQERLAKADKLKTDYQINNLELLKANVEAIPSTEEFDKILAIDIVEHVIHPDLMIKEACRLLKTQGEMLITFPAMHDVWEDLFHFLGRIFRHRKRNNKKSDWDPDAHQYRYSLSKWIQLTEAGGFKLVYCRATTMFPPLHYLGIPRFWFTNRIIRRLDGFFCRLPWVRNFGQTLVCKFKKV